jgi:hypothetical protein
LLASSLVQIDLVLILAVCMLSDFERLRVEGEALLSLWKGERKQEGVQLEFKRKDGRARQMSEEDSQNLGKCLSGFSNAQGGVVIWGVEAVKGEDGLDCIQQLKPFVEFNAFKASIDSKIGPYLMPRHEDIEAIALPSSDDPEKGYVVVRIGPSQLRPHRSEAKGDKRYYRRASSGTYVMEHYEIVDMLRINTIPKLKVVRKTEMETDADGFETRTVVTLWLANESMITAKSPYLSIKTGNVLVRQTPNTFRAVKSFDEATLTLSGGPNDAVHPGTKIHVVDLLVKWKPPGNRYNHSPDGQFWSYETSPKSLLISGTFGCENAVREDFHLEISPMQIEGMFDKVRMKVLDAYRRDRRT